MNNGEYAILKSMVNSETAFSVYKTAEDQRLVFGWANVAIRTDGKTIVDSQNDIIAPEDLALAAYRAANKTEIVLIVLFVYKTQSRDARTANKEGFLRRQ